MKIKQFLVILALLCGSVGIANAQALDYVEKSNVKIVVPSIKNMIILCDLSAQEFVSVMKRYCYNDYGMSDAKGIDCSNGIEGGLVNAINSFYYFFNGGGVIFRTDARYLYPKSAITDLCSELAPYYTKREDGVDMYAFNHYGKAYGVMVYNGGDHYVVRITPYDSEDSRLKTLR